MLESQYYELESSKVILEIRLQKILGEEMYKSGNERFSPDFQTRCDLYKSKIIQQENLAKELRKKLRDMENNTIDGIKQKKMFINLYQLLSCKLSSIDSGDEMKYHEMNNNDVQMIGGAEILTI